MKIRLLVLLFTTFAVAAFGQEKFKLYHPEADAQKDINEAIFKAEAANKNVFITVGGNWCGWCKLFHELVTSDEKIKNYLADNYIMVHVNYSKENTNEKVLKNLEFPQRFGFPVFVILDSSGKRIHTQNSGYLEEGKGHSPKKVLEFLQGWSPNALNPENYKKK